MKEFGHIYLILNKNQDRQTLGNQLYAVFELGFCKTHSYKQVAVRFTYISVHLNFEIVT